MNKIFAIALKDATLRFSSWFEWLFFLILPIGFTIILAGGTGTIADNRILMLAVDQANSNLSAELISALENSEAVRVEVTELKKAEDQFSQRSVSTILIIPENFTIETLARNKIELELRQQPNNLNSLVAQQAVNSVISRVSSSIQIANSSLVAAENIKAFASPTDRKAYFDSSLEDARELMSNAPDRIRITQGSTPDQIEYDPRANSSAGQMITWVFIPLIGLSEMFATERQIGTLRRLLTTPTHKSIYLLGTILGQVTLALLQMTLLIGFGILVMKVNWGRDISGLAVMLLASALAAAALGTMLGTFVKTSNQAQGVSIMLGMVMALLGGCWYPIELFPQVVQTIVKILPTTWAMKGFMNLLAHGQNLIGVLPEASVLLVFASIFFVVGIVRFRYE
ncbi:MAG: ABC transporter permease [Chloroflexota bacterium]